MICGEGLVQGTNGKPMDSSAGLFQGDEAAVFELVLIADEHGEEEFRQFFGATALTPWPCQ